MKEKQTEKHGKIKTVNAGPAGEETNTVAKIQAFIEDNRNLVIGISAGIIILVVGVFLLNNYMQKKEKENNEAAAFALSFAQEIYLGNQYEKALYGDSTKLVNGRPMLGLVEIVEKYESTNPAKVAALYAGDCYYNLGDYDNAEKYLTIASESDSPVIKEGAYAGLAVCSELKGDFDKAVDYYEKAIAYAKTTEAKNRYEYFQALSYEKLGDTAKAEMIYKKLIAEDASEFANLSKGALAKLGTKIE